VPYTLSHRFEQHRSHVVTLALFSRTGLTSRLTTPMVFLPRKPIALCHASITESNPLTYDPWNTPP